MIARRKRVLWWALALGAGALGFVLWRRRRAAVPGYTMTIGPVTVERTPSGPSSESQRAPLVVDLDLRVGTFEKMLTGNLSAQATATATRLAKQLQTQKLDSTPKFVSTTPSSLSTTDIPGGLRVTASWDAQYPSAATGALPANVQSAMLAIAKADPYIGSRVTALNAYRPA